MKQQISLHESFNSRTFLFSNTNCVSWLHMLFCIMYNIQSSTQACVLLPQTTLTSLLPFGKNFMVGNPRILMSGSSLAVASILAMRVSSLSLYFSPSSSQMGANCLQWPHHGASKVKHTRYWSHFILQTLQSNRAGFLPEKKPFSVTQEV